MFLFIYLLIATSFLKINCSGCVLCGMTHAVRYAFRLDFVSAYQSNRYVFYALGIFALLGIDMVVSFGYLIAEKLKVRK